MTVIKSTSDRLNVRLDTFNRAPKSSLPYYPSSGRDYIQQQNALKHNNSSTELCLLECPSLGQG